MLRAEESTRSDSDSDQQEQSKPTGRLVARCGIQAINDVEREICGGGAVYAAAAAEGLALSGERAATLLRDEPSSEPAGAGTTRAAWVHHRLRPGQPGFGSGMAFELVASSAQEALDHCLVAHRMADRLGSAGLCTADRLAVSGPRLVRLPDAQTIAAVLDDAGSAKANSTVFDVARDAFDRVAQATGRPAEPVRAYRMDDAQVALIACGGSYGQATQLADAARHAGVACGVVGVALLRPFPLEDLRRAVGDVQRVIVAPATSDPAEQDQFISRVRAALGDSVVVGTVLPGEWDEAKSLDMLDLDAEQRDSLQAARRVETEAGERFVLGAAPAGSWSDQFLLDAAALLGTLGRFELRCPGLAFNAMATLALGQGAVEADASTALDLLFVADPSLLGADESLLAAVRQGGTIVVGVSGDSPQSAVDAMGAERLNQIAAREIRLKWVNSAKTYREGARPACVRTQLLGAFLSADEALARLVRSTDLIGSLCSSDAVVGCEARTAELLKQGAGALQTFDPAALDPADSRRDPDVRPPRTKPLMPEGSEESAATTDWREAVHRFHLSGEGAYSAAEPLPPLPLSPAGLAPLAGAGLMWTHYPFVLLPDGTAQSFSALVGEAVEAIDADGGPTELLREHARRLARTVSRVLERDADRGGLHEIVDGACELFGAEFELSESGAAELQAELDRFKQHLPPAGQLIRLEKGTLLRFYAAALLHERAPRRFDFVENVKRLIVQLDNLLVVDHSTTPEGRSAAALSAELGAGSGMRIDPEVLANNLPAHRGSKRMSTERRERIERTLATLRGWVEQAPAEPECVLVHADLLPEDGPLPAARTIRHPDGLEAAIGLFDGTAAKMTEVVRAVRVARLEAAGAYDPEVHDDVLARFDWQAFSEDELLLMPQITAVESGARLRGRALAAFSALLRSGRPVQVLVLDDSSAELSGYHPGLGYIAVAHREAFVLQSTLAHPHRLFSGLRRMATVLGPAAALISMPSWSVPIPPWVQLAAMHFGRGAPLFRYDPAAGETWADRFDLSENPRPELSWTTPETTYVDESGEEHPLDERFTFAHAAALDPLYRPQFRVIPRVAWSEEQVPIADYLIAGEDEWRRLVPFIWVVDDDGVLARAVMTREMAFSCLDSARAWRILQELGGADNEYARRAAHAAREQALAEAAEERAKLEAEHAEALDQAGRAAASDAMERLVAVMMSEDALTALSTGAAPAAAPTAPVEAPPQPVEEEEEVAVEEEEAEEEAVSFNEPYITAALCTTCNECTNLNGRMFQYNQNKQATIADAGAGTFEELVKAAEKCPARCIHPGAPREGDATVTDDLLARAAKFN